MPIENHSQDEQIDSGLDNIAMAFHGDGEDPADWPPQVRRLLRRIFRKMKEPGEVQLFKLSHDRFVLRWDDGRIGLG